MTDRVFNNHHHHEKQSDPVVETHLLGLSAFVQEVQQLFLVELDFASHWVPKPEKRQRSKEIIYAVLEERFGQSLDRSFADDPRTLSYRIFYSRLIKLSPQQISQIVNGLLAHKEAQGPEYSKT